MGEALNDWLNLLQGTVDPPFTPQTNFQDEWKRLLRLISLVLLMIVAVITFSTLGFISSEGPNFLDTFLKSTSAQIQYTVLIVLSGAFFATLYALISARIFNVSINIRQAFFTVLFLILPWIPIGAFVRALGIILGDIPLKSYFIIIFLFIFLPLLFVYRFGQGIATVSGCKMLRCLASIAVPLLLILVLLIAISLLSPNFENENVPSEPDEAFFRSFDFVRIKNFIQTIIN